MLSMLSTAGLRRRRSKQKGEVNHLKGKREGGGAGDRDEREIKGGLLYLCKAVRGTRCPIGQG